MSTLLALLWLAANDGGAAPIKPPLSPEDQEVLQNLELLESLDEAKDLELLEELSLER